MSGVTGYIGHNEETGVAFMGLIIQDQITQVNWFVADKPHARGTVNQIITALKALVQELENTPDKLVTIKGVPDGTFRKREG